MKSPQATVALKQVSWNKERERQRKTKEKRVVILNNKDSFMNYRVVNITDMKISLLVVKSQYIFFFQFLLLSTCQFSQCYLVSSPRMTRICSTKHKQLPHLPVPFFTQVFYETLFENLEVRRKQDSALPEDRFKHICLLY